MLVFDKLYKPKTVYQGYSNDLLKQMNNKESHAKRCPIRYEMKPYPITKMRYDYSFTPHTQKIKHTGSDLANLKIKHIPIERETHLEEDVLKPLFGVENKPMIESGNPNYYQFKLQGKTDTDIMLSNAQEDILSLDILKANAVTGGSLVDSNTLGLLKKIKNIPKKTTLSKEEFVNAIEAIKKRDTHITREIKEKKNIKLKPIAAIDIIEESPVADHEPEVGETKKTPQRKDLIKMTPEEALEYIEKGGNYSLFTHDSLDTMLRHLGIKLSSHSVKGKKIEAIENQLGFVKRRVAEIEDLLDKN